MSDVVDKTELQIPYFMARFGSNANTIQHRAAMQMEMLHPHPSLLEGHLPPPGISSPSHVFPEPLYTTLALQGTSTAEDRGAKQLKQSMRYSVGFGSRLGLQSKGLG